jgi:hypothetical protein
MKRILIYIGIISFLALSFCTRPPELPVIPSIKFESVSFEEVEGPDSLIFSIFFQDGDGDLGLTSNDIYYPYQAYNVKVDQNGDTLFYGDSPEMPPYNPLDYIITRDEDGNAEDTIWVEINLDHYNIFVRFFEKKNGEYEEFDWRDPPYFQTFDGRFPLLNTRIKDNRLVIRPLEGSLRYGMTSSGWLFLFRDTLKLEIMIQDRALNKSNSVTSPDFTLDMITVDPEL